MKMFEALPILLGIVVNVIAIIVSFFLRIYCCDKWQDMNLENDSTCEEEISRTDFTSYDNESYLVDPPDDADVEDVESVVEVSTE